MIPSTGPNLARAPFVNARPVRRLSAFLWLLALGLIAWNVRAYLDSGAGATVRRAELAKLRAGNAESRERIQTIEADLRRADLVLVNVQTEYLNQRIAERAFSWNLLLDDLVEVMPRQVRLQRLAPEGFRDDRSRGTGRTPSSAERRVSIRLSGEAADDETLLEFVDRLFAQPSFDSPNLSSESRNRSGSLDFEVTIGYRAAKDLPGSRAETAALAGAVSPGAPPLAVAAEAAETERPELASSTAVASSPASGAGATTRVDSSAEPGRRVAPEAVALGRPAAAEPAPRRVGAAELAPAAEERTQALDPVAEPTPALSIFGVPLGAKPYASGGGR